MKKAVIVGVSLKNDVYDIDYSLDELTNLALANDILVVDMVKQNLEKVNNKFYVGTGKVEEIKQAVINSEADLIIFDDELSATQLRNLENEIDCQIIDRTILILDIFAKRAKSTEAMLEIKLAQNKYLLPRIKYVSKTYSRQGGSSSGFSSKGPGEKQIELDKRILLNEIVQLTKQLEKVRQRKVIQIEKRKENNMPIVSLVGYTNAGKSSTMNTLLNYTLSDESKQVLEKDQLFATLDTSTRKITYKNHTFLLTDTVGFVSKLPHHLVNSFKQTLEEIKNSDLIIHVIDISSPHFLMQYEITNSVLNSLGANDIKTIVLLNKYDLYIDNDTSLTGVLNMPFSNKTSLNVKNLLDFIYDETNNSLNIFLNVNYTEGKMINFIETSTNIISKVYMSNYILYNVLIPKNMYEKLKKYEISNLNVS